MSGTVDDRGNTRAKEMMLDIRPPMQMRFACSILLQIAEKPLEFSPRPALIDNGKGVTDVARLARQASASVVLNCASELWSTAVTCLLALEPAFPFAEDVAQFIKDSRMPWISYLSWVYKMCKRPFKGGASYQKAKAVIDLRDEIMHSRPEPYDHLKVETLAGWRKKLEPLVGKPALDWLPVVGHTVQENEGGRSYYADGSEPTIMKVMKYPIAKWVVDTTEELCDEMLTMMREHPGPKRVTDVASGTMSPDALWLSGMLVGRSAS